MTAKMVRVTHLSLIFNLCLILTCALSSRGDGLSRLAVSPTS
jgi:hypothetical protein